MNSEADPNLSEIDKFNLVISTNQTFGILSQCSFPLFESLI